jgi:hypothetical protein
MADKDWFEHKMRKLRQKRDIKFRAFFVNLAFIIVACLCCMAPWCSGMIARATPAGFWEAASVYMMLLIGIWKIAGIALFLAPALAIWWEMSACASRHKAEK